VKNSLLFAVSTETFMKLFVIDFSPYALYSSSFLAPKCKKAEWGSNTR